MRCPDHLDHGASLGALLRRNVDWLWACDADGLITDWSAGRLARPTFRLAGLRFEDTGWRFTGPDGREMTLACLLAAGEPFSAHGHAPSQLGSVRCKLTAEPAPGAKGNRPGYFGSICLSPPEHRQEHEDPYRSLYRHMPFPCWVYDLRTLAFLDVNPAAERTYGYTRDEFMSMRITDLPSPDESGRLAAFLQALAHGNIGNHQGQWMHRTATGDSLVVQLRSTDIRWNGRPSRMVFVTDITAQRAAHLEIKLLHECLDSAGDMIVVTRADRDEAGNHPIVYVNRAFELRTGHSRAEVLGHDPRLLQGPGTDPEPLRGVRQALTDWRSVTVELLNYTKGGEPYWVEMTITPVTDERGWHHYWFAVERDISDRKLAQFAMTDLNAELEARVDERTRELRQTVHDLESFSHSVSHDLQNPLNGVRGFADLMHLKHAAAMPPDALRMLGLIQRSARHMHDIIHDLLSLSRITRMEPRPVLTDLAALCLPLVDEWRAQHPHRRVQLLMPPVLEVHADLQLLRVVLENLVGNAWKYSAGMDNAVITLSARRGIEGTVVTLADNGAGFDSAEAQGLFTPFRRLHSQRQFEGTGIGLATVARAVDRLGGWIWADGKPGHGARFHFFLPYRSPGRHDGQAAPDTQQVQANERHSA